MNQNCYVVFINQLIDKNDVIDLKTSNYPFTGLQRGKKKRKWMVFVTGKFVILKEDFFDVLFRDIFICNTKKAIVHIT